MSRRDSRELVRASPLRARSLFTVRAAISSATPSGRPSFFRPALMCLYCLSRFLLHACCGMVLLLRVDLVEDVRELALDGVDRCSGLLLDGPDEAVSLALGAIEVVIGQ